MSLADHEPILALISSAYQVPARSGAEIPADLVLAALTALERDQDDVVPLVFAGERFFVCRSGPRRTALLVAGPYRRLDDPVSGDSVSVLDPAMEQRLPGALRDAARAIHELDAERHQRLELASQLELLGSAIVAITGQLEFELVLRRIVDLARELVGARYAALGVPDERGAMAAFVTSGLTAEEEARISHPPRGLGILGLLLNEPRTLRLANLADHPASVGFPAGHPPMRSFLGVPIVARGQVLGNLYLTEKRIGHEFTLEDERLIEMLARHAAVAIENANLYARLDREDRRLRMIVDQLPEAIAVMEANPDRVTLVNRQTSRLLGWQVETPLSLETYIRMNPRYELTGEPMPFERVPIVRALRAGEVVPRGEVIIARPDGSRITSLVNVAPIFDERGNVTAAVAVFQDITQIKDAEQLKDDFLSLVSHELRTPLTTIQGGTHLLRHDGPSLDDATRAALLDDITSESTRLGILVENMVQLSNIRAGRFVMETEPVLLRIAIERAVQSARTSAPDRAFTVDVPSNLLADADPMRLDQVLRNLLRNAVKYTPAGSPIEVEAHREGDLAIIAIRDHGPGIDPDDIPFVFDRFRRGTSATRAGADGMGLGLYLTRHLIEAHGGSIWIEQPADGGTRFSFSLPIASESD